MKFLQCILVITALFFGSAQAEDRYSPHPYVGMTYSYVDAELYGYSVDNGLLGALVGFRFHQNFAVDFRAYANASDGDIFGAKVEVERSFSALAKGIIPVHEYFELYGLFGIATSKITASYGSLSGSESDEDIQYGIGIAINKGEALETQIEWMKLYDDNNLDASGINLNIVYHMF
ncbi:outer membrane protein with beta-barrel domain [Vibrio diazotrophicus]|uniref:Outer membrane protein with beta-barrel domain n=1 Tax=Vibrio diazotrophicus TaxID=685 RepID=A0A329E4X4_VIBDI|nr:porin family protein [Vibrio diazotrophicus]RAS53241.1 outer membrane protein with beta-barrel domain [Vibrio diazotrophicus]